MFNKRGAIIIRGVSLLITNVSPKNTALTNSKFSCVGYLNYSNKSKQVFDLDKKGDALEQRKKIFKDTESTLRHKGESLVRNFKHQTDVTGQRFREKKDDFVKDLLETRAKVKGRIEEVVEVGF